MQQQPYIGLVFSLGKYQYKVQQIDESEVITVRLDSDGKETEKIKKFALGQWPPADASFENHSKEKDNKSSSKGGSKDRNRVMPPHQEYDDFEDASDYPSVTFYYDTESQKLLVKDKRGRLKQEIPIMTIKGKDGESAYDAWCRTKPKGTDVSPQAFAESLEGKPGKNGKNAYEEWQEWRGYVDSDEKAYWNYFKGDKGKDAFEQWKEVHREYENPDIDDFFEYLKGENGKDAYEVWRDLGYNGDRNAFFKWIAGFVETQKGEDGKIYYPHFDGFTLYFTEDKEGLGTRLAAQNIRGKDGRTFKPKFEGTKLYFDDEEGEKTDEVDLRGKNAYELWIENGHEGASFEDFQKFFSGRVVHKKYDYKDIKDYKAPVQHINRQLLADSETIDASMNAEQYYLYRQQKIEEIRDEGRKKRGNPLQEFFWWCAGADTSVLRMCPADYSKYMGIGTVIFFTAMMAFFSSFTAMQFVFNAEKEENFYLGWLIAATGCLIGFLAFLHYGMNRKTIISWTKKDEDRKKEISQNTTKSWTGIVSGIVIFAVSLITGILCQCKDWLVIEKSNGIAAVFAIFWAAMIFFLDRFITNTMYSDGKTTISWLEFRSGLPRIIISIFLGIVISAPLELRIFKTSIEQQIVVDRQKETEAFEIDCRNKAYKNLCGEINDLKSTIDRDSISIGKYETKLSTITKDYPKQEDYKTNKNNFVGDGSGKWIFTGQTEVPDVDAYNKAITIWNDQHPEYNETNKLAMELRDKRENNKLKLDSLTKNLNDTITKIVKIESEKFVCKQDTGLLRRLSVLHKIAMQEGKTDGYKKLVIPHINVPFKIKNKQYFIYTEGMIVFIISLLLGSLFYYSLWRNEKDIKVKINMLNMKLGRENNQNDEEYNIVRDLKEQLSMQADQVYDKLYLYIPLAVVIALIVGLNLPGIWSVVYYLMTPVGLIMLLFILIDVSPVFYKMMLADGRYDKILHQDKLIENDLIKLRLAKSLQKVNESELSSLSPFIFGRTFDKIKDLLTEKVCKDKKAVTLYDPNDNISKDIKKKNEELFQKVLGMKYRIAYASYAAWYRNMYDLRLGYKECDEGMDDSPEVIKDKFIVTFRSVPEVAGDIRVTPEKDAYTQGSVIHAVAENHDGYRFVGWRDNANASAERDISIAEDKIYVAYFEKETDGMNEKEGDLLDDIDATEG